MTRKLITFLITGFSLFSAWAGGTPNTITHQVESSASTDELESSELIVYSGGGQERLQGFIPEKIKPPKRSPFVTTIVGTDDRWQIKKTSVWPYSAHGMFLVRWKKKEYQCSGTMVNRRHVLTSAHCLYDEKLGGWADSIVYYPAKNGKKEPFKPAQGTHFYTTTGWTDEQLDDYDYGMVVLDRDVGKETGWYGLIVLPSKTLKGKWVTVTGYPGDKGGQTMWTDSDQIKDMSSSRLEYYVDSMKGQSGSAVWLEWPKTGEDNYYIVGVDSYGHRSLPYNYGPRMNKGLFNKVMEWIREH